MLSQPLRIGIIGSGFMGKTYARTVNTLVDKMSLAAVAGGAHAQALAAEYNAAYFPDWERLVESPEVDAVFIATPHACHSEQALAAAMAGKHLLIEKPMATSVDACDAILNACQASDVQCSVMFTQRTRVCFAKAKELLDSGKLGRPIEIRSYQIVPDGLKKVPAWQLDPANIGFLFGHGIHNFDGIRYLTGQEITSVFAKCRTLTNAPVEATSDVIVTLDDGTVHYIFCTFELPKPGFPHSEVGVRIACEHGLLDIDPYNETRVAYAGGDWETLAVQPRIDWAGQGFLDPVRLQAYAEVLNDFAEAIHEERPPRITGWDGRQAVAAALAAYESSHTGSEIVLPPVIRA